MMKQTLAAAVTAALFGIASVSWAQGAAAGGEASSRSSTTPGAAMGGPAASGATSSTLPPQCGGMTGMERERCLTEHRGAAAGGTSDRTPTHPGDPAKADNRYNSPATGTGAHSVPRSGAGTGTRQ